MVLPVTCRSVAFSVFVAILSFAGVVHAGAIEEKQVGITPIGRYQVDQFTLTNSQGASAEFISYGATLTRLFLPDKNGKMGDVVLGYDKIDDYEASGPAMGCIPGRFSNRIGNGTFTIDGIQYFTTVNQGMNTLHGGFKGYAKRVWTGDAGMTTEGPAVRFTLHDPDGTEGFPGNLDVTVIYTLTHKNVLRVQYYAHTDKATPVNLTHHSFFNFSGNGKGDVLKYVARIHAAHYLPMDDTEIPTGDIARVDGTAFDFRKAKEIGKDIKGGSGTPPGYDHTMVLDNPKATLMEAAEVYDPDSGREVDCWTTEPAVLFYSASALKTTAAKGGGAYGSYQAFCLETQHYPDSPNHSNFPNTILKPGQTYRQVTEFRFSNPEKPLEVGQ